MHFRLHLRPSILLALLGALLLSTLLVTPAHADPGYGCGDRKTLTGTWQVTINFTSGQLAGQTKVATVTYNDDGTLTSETTEGVPGTGIWYMTGKRSFHYEIDEQVQGGYIHVVQDGALAPNKKTNTATGGGTFYINTPNGPVEVGVNDANTTAERTDCNK